MSLMRTYRRALGLSQSAFAAQLNVPLETYRPWDAGRREPPPQLLTRARTLAGYPDDTVLLPLPVLALMIGVHVRTLHAAARSGRLGVAYDTRTTFRRLRPRATLKHALDFRRHYYGTQRRPPATPVPLTWASVPEDYDVQLKALRRHLDISQAGFARLVGAAGKAVVYQWEARKRTPSPLFWQRVHELQSEVHPRTDLVRRYGRGHRGERVVDHAPDSRWHTTTFLAALRVTGLTAKRFRPGACLATKGTPIRRCRCRGTP